MAFDSQNTYFNFPCFLLSCSLVHRVHCPINEFFLMSSFSNERHYEINQILFYSSLLLLICFHLKPHSVLSCIRFVGVPNLGYHKLLSRVSDLDMGVAQLFSAVISINLMECFEQNKISFQASPYVQEDGCMSGLSSLGVPGVPWHPQILAHQLTLNQGGRLCPHITTGTPGFSDLPTALQGVGCEFCDLLF